MIQNCKAQFSIFLLIELQLLKRMTISVNKKNSKFGEPYVLWAKLVLLGSIKCLAFLDTLIRVTKAIFCSKNFLNVLKKP